LYGTERVLVLALGYNPMACTRVACHLLSLILFSGPRGARPGFFKTPVPWEAANGVATVEPDCCNFGKMWGTLSSWMGAGGEVVVYLG